MLITEPNRTVHTPTGCGGGGGVAGGCGGGGGDRRRGGGGGVFVLRLGGEGWREGWEDIGPCMRREGGLKTFFNEMSFKKQTVCRAKCLQNNCLDHNLN
ncbi:hypothetical protein Hanom_Chr04g00362031 [Helianthus anomalus]